MTDNKIKLENETIEQNEKSVRISSKTLLVLECVICFIALAVFLAITAIVSYCNMSVTVRLVLVAISFVNLLIYCFVAIYIEVKAGYHVCEKCGHKHQASYLKTILAPHVGWTRYMKCPKCGKRSWQSKKF